MQRFLTNYTFLPPSAFEVGTCTYTCLAVALRFVGLAFRLSSLSDSIARLLELFAVETNGFGESTSISLAGVVDIDGLLKREASAVEGDSDCEGEQNLALLRGGMGAVKGTSRRQPVKGAERRQNEGGASRSLVGNKQEQTSATGVPVRLESSPLGNWGRDATDCRPKVQHQ
jgi:hypothetical protein